MRVPFSLLLVLGLVGCDDSATLVVVRVDSDLSVPDELDEVVVEVAGQSARAPLGGPDDAPLPRTLELRATGDGLGPYTVTARGLRGGVEVATERRDVMFVADRTVEVRITLTDSPTLDGGMDDGGMLDGGMLDAGMDDAGADEDAGPNDAGPLPDGCLVEACNAMDDDCDGDIDEGDACAPCVRSEHGRSVYMTCDLPVNRTTSVTECQSRGYHLAKIEVVLENEHVQDQVAALGAPAWIGLMRRGGSPNFDWDDGSAMTFEDWGTGEPMGGGRNCVLVDGTDGWRTEECATAHPFVCEAP